MDAVYIVMVENIRTQEIYAWSDAYRSYQDALDLKIKWEPEYCEEGLEPVSVYVKTFGVKG